ncbi:MAG: folylpolyglutamate synthase/dihydrofolate synthase family protein [Phycisphaerales bacterium]
MTSKPAPMRRPGRDAAAPTTTAADITSYTAALKYLYDRSDIERMRTVRYDQRTFKLDRMRQLLDRLGNPEAQVKMVHVAGTVGKGSTVAMIAQMLRGCGYTVGMYTSPHLVDVRERIMIDGHMIGRAEFAELMKEVAHAARKLDSECTFFELMTAVAFKHFANQAVDIAVVEVGLGGRLDSTNVITPEVSVICTIDHDHNRLLGQTLPEIAREKAGILKRGVPGLTFEQAPDIEQAIREIATKVGAPLQVVNKEIEFSSRFCATPDLGPHTRVCLFTSTSRFEHLPVPLAGEHQAVNCGLALAAVDILKSRGFDCPEDKITAGLAQTVVPGRMQMLSERPKILVDGAHNPAAVGALMRCVGAHVPYDSMVCVFGCCADKDVGTLLDRVNLGADKVVFTRAIGNPRAADPDELQRMFAERSGKMSQVGRTFAQALELALSAVSREDLIVVTGSFYLVGEAMKYIQERRERGAEIARVRSSHGRDESSRHPTGHGTNHAVAHGAGHGGHHATGAELRHDTRDTRDTRDSRESRHDARGEPKADGRTEARADSKSAARHVERNTDKPASKADARHAPRSSGAGASSPSRGDKPASRGKLTTAPGSAAPPATNASAATEAGKAAAAKHAATRRPATKR